MRNCLFLPISIEDHLSFLLNILPTTKSRRPLKASPWFAHWPILCEIFHELDHFFHHKLPLSLSYPGRWLLS
ncbi:MAG: hypothetical protein EXX96DRAFT_591378 [Benjaminiella poitrasii]|nr:MAG: hypothetical protein EXX96DRAFT_592319 [Benjaminiella poitrasii]KAI9468247.1 MAG: hypothetical protein EXX96DRAFT_591378 [Benjaminiella poitrasii]